MGGDDETTDVRRASGSDLDVMLVHNLLRTHGRLLPLVDAHLRRRNLTGAQLNALLVLRAAGGDGLRMNEIGRRLVVTKSNVTGLVDRLQRQGLVARTAGRDRRATLVRLTPAGVSAVRRTAGEHTRLLARVTACLTAREKRTLIRLLTKLRRRLRQMREDRS